MGPWAVGTEQRPGGSSKHPASGLPRSLPGQHRVCCILHRGGKSARAWRGMGWDGMCPPCSTARRTCWPGKLRKAEHTREAGK